MTPTIFADIQDEVVLQKYTVRILYYCHCCMAQELSSYVPIEIHIYIILLGWI